MPRIDAHVHVFARSCPEFPREISDQLPAEREEPVEKLLAEMETNGVDQAVLVQIGGERFEQHAYLRHCLKAYAGRFLGIGLVPEDEPSPQDHMDRLPAEGDVIGFRLMSMGGPVDPLAPMDVRTFSTYPIWKHAADEDYVLWLYPQAVDAHTVPFLIDAFPGVRVVFNHMLATPGKGSFSWDEKGRPRWNSHNSRRRADIRRWGCTATKTSTSTFQVSTPSANRHGHIAISPAGTSGCTSRKTACRVLGRVVCCGRRIFHGS